MRGECLQHFGRDVLSHKANKFFQKGILDLFVGGAFDGLYVGICGVYGKTASRLRFDVEIEPGSSIFERQFEAGKFRSKSQVNVRLDFLLQFFRVLACRAGMAGSVARAMNPPCGFGSMR